VSEGLVALLVVCVHGVMQGSLVGFPVSYVYSIGGKNMNWASRRAVVMLGDSVCGV